MGSFLVLGSQLLIPYERYDGLLSYEGLRKVAEDLKFPEEQIEAISLKNFLTNACCASAKQQYTYAHNQWHHSSGSTGSTSPLLNTRANQAFLRFFPIPPKIPESISMESLKPGHLSERPLMMHDWCRVG